MVRGRRFYVTFSKIFQNQIFIILRQKKIVTTLKTRHFKCMEDDDNAPFLMIA